MTSVPRAAALAVLSVLALAPLPAAAIIDDMWARLPGPPPYGTEFPFDSSTDYTWSVPLEDVADGTEIANFTLNVIPAGANLPKFEVFSFGGEFDLFIDDTPTAWTELLPAGYFYHIFEGDLPGGLVNFRVEVAGNQNLTGDVAEFQLGYLATAIPLPGALPSALGGLLVVAGVAMRRRPA
ncbi:hypothetical protein [Tropicimonas sp. IMCC34043]|uniref:hypothetical protein n=1 Tax=Tropicimonas sp. IMCC34043 TaxID=2248760 RepID=UPI0013003552|nr:hypothetical protein [Tropicimonas sp. IMCC34043]